MPLFFLIVILAIFFGYLILNAPALAFSFVPVTIFFVSIYKFFKDNVLFLFFTILVYFPIVLPLGLINNMRIVFLLSPLLFFIMFFKLFVKKEIVFFRGSCLFLSAIFILILWTIIGFFRNYDLLELNRLNVELKIGVKGYLSILTGVGIYFLSLYYVSKKNLDCNQFLLVLFVMSLVVGLLRVFSYHFNFNLPFLGEEFLYSENPAFISGSVVDRIGGIDRCCTIGVPAIMALFYRKKIKYLFLIIFFSLAVLGGGRSLFFGLIFYFLLYISLFEKKDFGLLMILSVPLTILVSYFMPDVLSSGQFLRIFKIDELLMQDPHRMATYRYYWSIFIQNPFFGKGIGPYTQFFNAPNNVFTNMQLVSGGHGSYLSILAVFGLGGIFYLLVFVIGGIVKGYFLSKKFVSRKELSGGFDKLSLFIFSYLVLKSLMYISGGNGLNDLSLYFTVGMLSGLLIKKHSDFNRNIS